MIYNYKSSSSYNLLLVLCLLLSIQESQQQRKFDIEALNAKVTKLGLHCKWVGSSPFCQGHCPVGWALIVLDETGDGKNCVTGKKAFCCQY